jgi:LmbE family N-acetylglucosaminyl deacetylase
MNLAALGDGDRPTLLAVLAHPDDESFGMGGTLAFYAWCGVAVHLICATGGEEGDVAPQYLEGYGSPAARRAAELACAASALGLASVTMLGYRDSGMPGAAANQHPQALCAQPTAAVAARVAAEIRRLRPQVLITFDPIGGYRHPDHLAIQRATVEAFHATSGSGGPQRLYFHTFSRRLLRLAVRLMPLLGRDPRRFGNNGDIDLVALADVEFPIHAEVDVQAVARARAQAGACHASQGGGSGMLRGPLGWLFNLIGGRESFMRAYPEAPPARRERDLFAGVEW